MVKRSLLTMLFAMLATVFGTTSASAQIVPDAPSFAGGTAHFTYWNLDFDDGSEETLTQFAVPLSGFVPLARDFEARFYVGNSINSLERGTEDLNTSGLSDLRLKVSRSFFQDMLLLSGGLSLPTGKTELGFEGRTILNRLASNFIELPIRRFGEGLGISLQAAAARQFESVELGASVSYDIYGEYDPFVGVTGYDPGDAFNITGGITLFNDRTSVGATVGYTSFTNDQLDGTDVFKQGNYLLLALNASFTNYTGDIRVKPHFNYVARGENKRFSDLSEEVESELKLYGDEFTALVRLEADVSETVSAGPTLSYRWIGENDEGFGNSNLLGVGGHIVSMLGQVASLSFGATYYSGSADEGTIDLAGFHGTVGLTATF